MNKAIVWFRRDVRLEDNPAWARGTEADLVCPLFVVDPRLYDMVTDRRRQLLVAGLDALDQRIRRAGGRLRVERGDPTEVVPAVTAELRAGIVHANREVTPYGVRRDRSISSRVDLEISEGTYVQPPGSVLTQREEPYRVFTPFLRQWLETPLPSLARPGAAQITRDPGIGVPSPTVAHDAGEEAAMKRLEAFLERADTYHELRDRPDLDATSRLSTDLKYGWLGPATVVRTVGRAGKGPSEFVRQMAWRDFYAHLLSAHPQAIAKPMRSEYANIEWRNDPNEVEAWKSGLTGYPLIDAAMRQLAATGWIHNRLRMLVASFLVKDLLVDWRIGERFFRRHLVDGDVAQNVGNWQWVAGTGTDAAPYFRVFNPVTQSKRYDPEGTYIRSWVPELEAAPRAVIHAPWRADPAELAGLGIVVGKTYPEPIVDHAFARLRAIETYERARSNRHR